MRGVTLIVAGLLALVRAQMPRDDFCPSPFTLVAGTCYHIPELKKVWSEARKHCTESFPDGIQVDLAVVSDCNQHAHLWNYIAYDIQRPEDYWIGAYDVVHEGEWKWITGAKVNMGVPYWYPEEPSGGEDENHLSLSKSGLFADENEGMANYFICQVFHL